eukprot:Lankesteria_metandrocarpae@DN2032_c0_g1_i1.p1
MSMKAVCVVISVAFLSTSFCSQPCCPNAKIYYAKYEPDVYLRSVETQHYSRREVEHAIAASIANAWSISQLRGLEETDAGDEETDAGDEETDAGDEKPEGVLQNDKCLFERADFNEWEAPASGNHWEMRSNSEMQFTRFVVDMLKTGRETYWTTSDETEDIPEKERVIALWTETRAIFSTDWIDGPMSNVTNVCQDGVKWNAADLVDALKDLNGWFVIVASDLEVKGTWEKWYRDDWTPLASEECGNGCRISIVLDSGNALYDVQQGLEGVEFGHNRYKSCVACKYEPGRDTKDSAVLPDGSPYEESSGGYTPLLCLFNLMFLLVVWN